LRGPGIRDALDDVASALGYQDTTKYLDALSCVTGELDCDVRDRLEGAALARRRR
jgi:hypothetical protein